MGRFYFHVYDDVLLLDDQGTELPDEAAARVRAVAYAGELLAQNPEMVRSGQVWSMEVTDAAGFLFWRLDLKATETRRWDA